MPEVRSLKLSISQIGALKISVPSQLRTLEPSVPQIRILQLSLPHAHTLHPCAPEIRSPKNGSRQIGTLKPAVPHYGALEDQPIREQRSTGMLLTNSPL